MKKPIALISNDWHLDPSNTELVIEIIREKIEYAKKNNVDHLFILGDLFDDRKHQRQVVLSAMRMIIDLFEKAKIFAFIIPGNHDKSDYNSSQSFLVPFMGITKCFYICHEYERYDIHGIRFHFMPFFNEELWLQKHTPELDIEGKNILLTHVGFQGSVNNDGSTITSPIKPILFNDYDLVLSGHYHNQQQIGKNIHHLSSLYQRNYGEDVDKGFTVLYDNLSFDLIQSTFPKFHKVVIDIDTINKKELETLTKDYSAIIAKGEDNVRFEFKGSEKNVKAIKKDIFTSNGIDVKTKIKEIEEPDIEFNEEVKKLDTVAINEKFVSFCETEALDLEVGQGYLNQILEN